MPNNGTYERLISLLDRTATAYELIDHEPEGSAETVSALRGHPVPEATKCLVLMVRIDRRVTRYVLAVVPGDPALPSQKCEHMLLTGSGACPRASCSFHQKALPWKRPPVPLPSVSRRPPQRPSSPPGRTRPPAAGRR